MYQVIFFEKTFSGNTEYITEPIASAGYKGWIGSLQAIEINTNTYIEVIIETSETGDTERSEDWVTISNPKVIREVGITTFIANNFLSWMRFRINIRNKTSIPNIKLTLSGNLHQRSV